MKKIISIAVIIALIATIFTFAACSGKEKDDMTTAMNELSSALDDMTTALDELTTAMDDMTENVTDDTTKDTTEESTTLMTDDNNE